MPDTGDEVLVAFEHGNAWVGWFDNGKISFTNLAQPAVARILPWNKKLDLRSTARHNDSAVVCVFNCSNPENISRAVIEKAVLLAKSQPNFQLKSDLNRLGFFNAIAESGKTHNVRSGMQHIYRAMKKPTAKAPGARIVPSQPKVLILSP